MCEISKNIKLCSCLVEGNIAPVIHNKNSRRHKKNKILDISDAYKWTLYKYIGTKDLGMEGLLYMPSDKLGEYLTNEMMLSALNNEMCFDFDYQANEGDNLVIYHTERGSYNFLSFIYKNQKWKVDSYNGFTDMTEKINFGKVITE